MTDDQIRSLLARQPRAETLPHPPGTVAILRQDIEGEKPDERAVERWIGKHSGESRVAPAAKVAIQRTGNGPQLWEGPFRYYVVPLGALVGKPRSRAS